MSIAGALATVLSGLAAITTAILGFFLRDKYRAYQKLEKEMAEILKARVEGEAVHRKLEEQLEELDENHKALLQRHEALFARVGDLDKGFAVEKARYETADAMRAILGRLDTLLFRTPANGMRAVSKD